jgi:hypothetical protein
LGSLDSPLVATSGENLLPENQVELAPRELAPGLDFFGFELQLGVGNQARPHPVGFFHLLAGPGRLQVRMSGQGQQDGLVFIQAILD